MMKKRLVVHAKCKTGMKEHDITSNEIQQNLEKQGVEISSRTIRRRLSESGGKYSKEILKPLLSEKHRVKRLQWAKKHQNLTGIELFSLTKAPFNYFGQIKRSGNLLEGERCSVRFPCLGLVDLVS